MPLTSVPINWQLGTLPQNLEAQPQAFYEAIFSATQAELDLSGFLVGQIGGGTPSGNVGPWLKDNKTWWVWNSNDSQYEPMASDLEIGDMVPTASESCDGDRFLFCDGRAISRSAPYDKLFAAIGTKFGEGDTTTTFNIPDCQGRVLIGAGIGHLDDGTALSQRILGEKGGLEMAVLDGTNIPVPTTTTAVGGTGAITIPIWNDFLSNGQPHNNMMPWLCCLMKVKFA